MDLIEKQVELLRVHRVKNNPERFRIVTTQDVRRSARALTEAGKPSLQRLACTQS
jgi:hypothetical protein